MIWKELFCLKSFLLFWEFTRTKVVKREPIWIYCKKIR